MIDTSTSTVVDTVDVGQLPYGVAVTPDGSTIYVANQVSGTVSVIDAATNTVNATLNVGTTPTEITITPDGTRAYVTDFVSPVRCL